MQPRLDAYVRHEELPGSVRFEGSDNKEYGYSYTLAANAQNICAHSLRINAMITYESMRVNRSCLNDQFILVISKALTAVNYPGNCDKRGHCPKTQKSLSKK